MDMNNIDINQMRIDMKEGDAIRDAGLVAPESILAKKDISYGEFGISNLLDVYYPKETVGKLPTIVNIHGGGFFYGDKELYQFYCISLAERGFCVVNFNYRLAPEYLFPSPLEDTNNVLLWMLANVDNYPFDLTNLFLVGDSAGAQLTEQYATISSNPDYAQLFSFKAAPVTFNAIGVNCGVYFLGQEESAKNAFPYYFDEQDTDSLSKLFPVESFITNHFPPTSITTATDDFLKELAQPLDAFLQSKGIETTYKLYEQPSGEPLYHVFHIGQKEAISHQCNDEQMAFFKRYII